MIQNYSRFQSFLHLRIFVQMPQSFSGCCDMVITDKHYLKGRSCFGPCFQTMVSCFQGKKLCVRRVRQRKVVPIMENRKQKKKGAGKSGMPCRSCCSNLSLPRRPHLLVTTPVVSSSSHHITKAPPPNALGLGRTFQI